jgi:hypothetical protein
MNGTNCLLRLVAFSKGKAPLNDQSSKLSLSGFCYQSKKFERTDFPSIKYVTFDST